MIYQVFSVVAPVFIIAAIGYLWARREQPFDTATVSSLVMFVGSPCLIYSSLTTNAPSLDALLAMVLAAVFVTAVSVLTALIVLKLLGWPVTTFLSALVHPNGGNMGLPVCLLAFGEPGLALGMAYFFVNSISQYTLGLSVASGQFQPGRLLRQPVIWAVVVVLTVLVYDIDTPAWFDATTTILGGLTIPAMLLMLGTSLTTLKLASVTQTLVISGLRLIMGLTLGFAAVQLFDLEGMIAGVVLLQATMPSAVFNYVFAQQYNREPEKVAGVVLVSTLMSVVTLPLMVAWVIGL